MTKYDQLCETSSIERAKKFASKYISKSQADNDTYVAGIEVGYIWGQKEYEEKLRWIPIEEPPTQDCLIILEYFGCGNKKTYVVYDFDPEYFEGVFHVNGVANRWRHLLI